MRWGTTALTWALLASCADTPRGDGGPPPPTTARRIAAPVSVAVEAARDGLSASGSIAAERLAVLAGARLAIGTGEVAAQHADSLPAALSEGYDRMEELGAVWTMVSAAEAGTAESLMVIEGSGEPPTLGVVFLHGYGGRFAIQCWHVARTFTRANARTVCPSVGAKGQWATRRGRRAVETSIAYLKREQVNRFVLVGLSNGARGAARWAPTVEPTLAGVVLISGGDRTKPPPGVPVLGLGAAKDRMFSTQTVRRYARQAGSRGRFVSLPGSHFAFLESWPLAAEAVDAWLLDAVLQ